MINIREARVGDARGIATVHVRSWQVGYEGIIPQDVLDALAVESREGGWRQRLEESSQGILVAEADGVVGWATFGAYRGDDAPEGAGEVHGLYVLPDKFGMGIGSQLWEAAMPELGDYAQIYLWVLEANQRARRFYEESKACVVDGVSKMHAVGEHELPALRYVIRRGGAEGER